ncbi:MAG: hypothetical protein M3O62_06420 [Pseudomonadota bacterium]|nr:hypothetical protein [Pseudomonadota bacterium]
MAWAIIEQNGGDLLSGSGESSDHRRFAAWSGQQGDQDDDGNGNAEKQKQ